MPNPQQIAGLHSQTGAFPPIENAWKCFGIPKPGLPLVATPAVLKPSSNSTAIRSLPVANTISDPSTDYMEAP